MKFNWIYVYSGDDSVPVGARAHISEYTITISYGIFKLIKKTLDKRRQVVVKQYVQEDFNKTIAALSSTPTNETTRFLEYCIKHMKLRGAL
jgi:hypothetical protein